MLKAALCGSYVNFGVFRLYGDEALDNALNTFVKLLLSIPQSDLLVNIYISHNTNILFISQIICFLIIKFISAALMNYCAMKQLKYLLYCYFYTLFFRQHYPKLSATYYLLLECLAQDHMVFLSTLEPRVFLYILSSISEGLTALGAQKDFYTGLCG